MDLWHTRETGGGTSRDVRATSLEMVWTYLTKVPGGTGS
jgi:hypothetical protein